MTGGKYRNSKAFTLIELLVVVAIIGLLASIMMPSLSKARELAKGASCISNLHNLGIMLTVYTTDNNRLYPTAYSYLNDNVVSPNNTTGGPGNGKDGYNHWSAAIEPNDYQAAVTAGKYPKTNNLFVCPTHLPGGWAPSHFTTTRIPSAPPGQASQNDSGGAVNNIDDKQTARLSYVANEVLMPRKKLASLTNICQVSADEVEGAGNTILLAEFSDSANGIYGSSTTGGDAYKSHRPTNGIKSSQANGVFDGETYTIGTTINKLIAWDKKNSEARTAIDAVKLDKNVAAANHHISYINPETHGSNGSNYTFADGHAAKATLEATFDPGNYMWGRKVYSCVDKPIIND